MKFTLASTLALAATAQANVLLALFDQTYHSGANASLFVNNDKACHNLSTDWDNRIQSLGLIQWNDANVSCIFYNNPSCGGGSQKYDIYGGPSNIFNLATIPAAYNKKFSAFACGNY